MNKSWGMSWSCTGWCWYRPKSQQQLVAELPRMMANRQQFIAHAHDSQFLDRLDHHLRGLATEMARHGYQGGN